MNVRKWRNPYDPLKKRRPATTSAAPRSALSAPPRKTALPVLPLDIRTSVTRIRSNIKGISSTIRQMEETMDTLYNAMEMVSALGKPPAKEIPPERHKNSRTHTRPNESGDGEEPTGNPPANFDLQQLFQLLQSPLIQSLLGQHAVKSETRKKEG